MALQIQAGEAYPTRGNFNVLDGQKGIVAIVKRGPITGKTWVSCNGRMENFPSRRKALAWLTDAMKLPAIAPYRRPGC